MLHLITIILNQGMQWCHWWLCDANTKTIGVTWPHKSCCISFQLCWCKEWNVAGFDAIDIMWYQHQCLCYISIWLSWLNKGIVPLMMPVAPCDGDAGGNGITWPEYSCSSAFEHLYITSGMMSLMTMLESCDTDTSIMALHDQKCCITYCFNHLDQ